ncbi:MAG: chorismate synthase [Candidatus Freyarchaeota archaeon]|nr:chorismate synthase [Candidatus Bathyarchaeota archaeon]
MLGGNVFGKNFVLVSFGESHGKCIGAVVDGCPAGLELSEEDVQRELDRRRPGGGGISTSRVEMDKVEILSGVFDGYTTGAPICMIVWNTDVDSSVYYEIKDKPRPGHADYTARVRYGGFNDFRGGGRFSGRVTVSLVMGGAVAKKVLEEVLGVRVEAYTIKIGGVSAPEVSDEGIAERYGNPVRCPDPDAAARMVKVIEKARSQGDSVGGVVECRVTGLPPGVGNPIFNSLEGDLSKALFSIPAVKAVEFGSGVKAADMWGSSHNDPFRLEDGKVVTESNNAGGILGGISTGMPIKCRVTFKPTPSISKPQKTVDLSRMEEVFIRVKGRHDPCIVPRAVPVVEAVVSMVLVDHAITLGLIPPVLRR